VLLYFFYDSYLNAGTAFITEKCSFSFTKKVFFNIYSRGKYAYKSAREKTAKSAHQTKGLKPVKKTKKNH